MPIPNGNWQHRANCRTLDVDYFFRTELESEVLKIRRKICSRCPVQAQCVQAHWREKYGVFFGTSPQWRQLHLSEYQAAKTLSSQQVNDLLSKIFPSRELQPRNDKYILDIQILELSLSLSVTALPTLEFPAALQDVYTPAA